MAYLYVKVKMHGLAHDFNVQEIVKEIGKRTQAILDSHRDPKRPVFDDDLEIEVKEHAGGVCNDPEAHALVYEQSGQTTGAAGSKGA